MPNFEDRSTASVQSFFWMRCVSFLERFLISLSKGHILGCTILCFFQKRLIFVKTFRCPISATDALCFVLSYKFLWEGDKEKIYARGRQECTPLPSLEVHSWKVFVFCHPWTLACHSRSVSWIHESWCTPEIVAF